MAAIDSLLVVCKYARDSAYADEARELAATAARFGYAIKTHEAPDLGDWWRNTANKPRYLLETLKQHDGPLLCLDADCRILQPLDELVGLLDSADLSVKYRPGNCLSALFNAAVLFVRRTPATLGVLDTWARRGEQFGSLHRFVEQGPFGEGMLFSQGALVCRELPERFHTMHPRDGAAPSADVAIIHLKTSRQQRQSALPADYQPPQLTDPALGSYITIRPRRTAPPQGLPMAGIDGMYRDFVEYASRFGIAPAGNVQAPVDEGDLAGLEAHKLDAVEQLCQHLPEGTPVVLSDYDCVYLRDPAIFTDALDGADVALAWDRRDRGALPATATWAFRVGPLVRDQLLPALKAAWNGPAAAGAGEDRLRRALALVLRASGPWRVATLLSESVADIPHAGRDTVVLSARGPMRIFQRGPALHMHALRRPVDQSTQAAG